MRSLVGHKGLYYHSRQRELYGYMLPLPTKSHAGTHTHQLREEAQGCTMMDEAAVTPFFAEAVVRSPLEEA